MTLKQQTALELCIRDCINVLYRIYSINTALPKSSSDINKASLLVNLELPNVLTHRLPN